MVHSRGGRLTLVELGLILAWVALAMLGWALYQLMAQGGRLVLRIEALERRLGESLVEPAATVGSDDATAPTSPPPAD